MCTVSLVPHPDSPDGFILTSNRDEAVSRKTLDPTSEVYKNTKIYCPVDVQAGGTWIGVSEKKRAVCLINGSEKPHTREEWYRKSRGIVVKDFLALKNALKSAAEYKLEGIEPFTMIVADWRNGLLFFEVSWDGKTRRITQLPLKEHIWSSSPLYSEEMKELRKKWFRELKSSKGFSPKHLLDFHHSGGTGDKNTDLIIDRGFLKTQSITQIFNSKEGLLFWYKNLKNSSITETYF